MSRFPIQHAPEQAGHAGGGGTPKSRRAQRLEELQIDRALFGLSPDDEAELLILLDEAKCPLDDSYEMTAAELDLALAPPAETMPAALWDRVLAAGETWAATRRAEDREQNLHGAPTLRLTRHGPGDRSMPGDTSMRLGWRAWGGWLAAAACLALAVISWNRTGPMIKTGPDGGSITTTTADLNPARLLTQLTGERGTKAAELVKRDEAMGPPPVAADVYWSDDRQTGVLRLTGLPAIRCPGDVYQLWITDALRDEQYPVDGGTFRVENGQTEVLLLIKPHVRVDCAVRFTITKERAGGAVVSDARSVVASGHVGPARR